MPHTGDCLPSTYYLLYYILACSVVRARMNFALKRDAERVMGGGEPPRLQAAQIKMMRRRPRPLAPGPTRQVISTSGSAPFLTRWEPSRALVEWYMTGTAE